MDWNDLYDLAFSVTADPDFSDSFASDHEFFDGDPVDLFAELC